MRPTPDGMGRPGGPIIHKEGQNRVPGEAWRWVELLLSLQVHAWKAETVRHWGWQSCKPKQKATLRTYAKIGAGCRASA